MTISISINNDFHRRSCPLREINQISSEYQNCINKEMRLNYRCSECANRCLKCEAPRLNTNTPYVRGCKEARLAITRTFSCVCTNCEL